MNMCKNTFNRIVSWWFTTDNRWIDMFKNNTDPHSETYFVDGPNVVANLKQWSDDGLP